MTLPRWVLAVLAAFALFVALDNMERPLANPDEGRYSEISREMAVSGDWVTPRLNGIKYFEKPPLQYWASAASIKVFGASEFPARLYTALCALICLVAVGCTAWRLAGSAAAAMSVGVLLSSPYFLGLGGIVTLDMGLTAWTTVSVCAFLLAVSAEGVASRWWMRLAWAGMALAVLSKGLIGIVFPAAAVFLHCLLHRDWRLLARLEWVAGSVIFLAIAAPWFVLVSMANPEFPEFFFIHEHFQRFLTKTHRREEPWWFFVPLFFVGFLPWALALIPSAIAGWRDEATRASFPWRRFALLWSGFIVFFFSLSGSKLPAYILPIFPVFALVLGDWLARAPAERLWKGVAVMAVVIALGTAFAWGVPERAKTAWTRELYTAARPWIVSGFVVLAASMAFAAWRLRRGAKWGALALIVGASLFLIDMAEDGYERLSPRQSGLIVAERIRPLADANTRIYSVAYYDQTIPFYLQRTVTLVRYVDELEQGLKAEPHLAIPTLEAFAADWARPGKAVAIIHPDSVERLTALGVGMSVLHRDDRRVVVIKP